MYSCIQSYRQPQFGMKSRNRFFLPFFTALLFLCRWPTQVFAAISTAGTQPPNILLIVTDDLGYGELSCQGNPQVPTPNIDSLAKGGTRFTSGYVTAPFCAPSRAGFITGRYQTRFGYDINPTGTANLNPNIGLPTNEITLANQLKRAGYATGLVGKWHLGATEPFHPQQRGFDEFYGFLHEGHYYTPLAKAEVTTFLRTNTLPPGNDSRWTSGNTIWSKHTGNNEPQYNADNPVMRGRTITEEKEFLTDAWAREASDFIQRHRSQPFFLYLAYNAPHSPMQALDTYLKRFAHIEDLHRRIFAAMIAHLDESVGKVLTSLRQAGLEDNTLIFFLSDNGGPTRELTSSNAPLSGGKGQLLEGGIRIPFIIQWKALLPTNRVFENPVISLDILPTALAATGISALNNGAATQLDGINLLPYLKGEKQEPPHATLFWRYGQNFAIRRGDWKLLKQGAKENISLFNLIQDISETNNLASQKPEMVRELQTSLEQWNATQAKRINMN